MLTNVRERDQSDDRQGLVNVVAKVANTADPAPVGPRRS